MYFRWTAFLCAPPPPAPNTHKGKPVYKPVKRCIFWKTKETKVENDLTSREDFFPLRIDVCQRPRCVRGWTLSQRLSLFS